MDSMDVVFADSWVHHKVLFFLTHISEVKLILWWVSTLWSSLMRFGSDLQIWHESFHLPMENKPWAVNQFLANFGQAHERTLSTDILFGLLKEADLPGFFSPPKGSFLMESWDSTPGGWGKASWGLSYFHRLHPGRSCKNGWKLSTAEEPDRQRNQSPLGFFLLSAAVKAHRSGNCQQKGFYILFASCVSKNSNILGMLCNTLSYHPLRSLRLVIRPDLRCLVMPGRKRRWCLPSPQQSTEKLRVLLLDHSDKPEGNISSEMNC